MINPYKAQSKINPQRDDQHRRVAKEVWWALVRADISLSGYKVVLHVIDRSWGYDKLEASIGYASFIKATGLSKSSIRNAISELVRKHILVAERTPGDSKTPSVYMFNKHFDTWDAGLSKWLTGLNLTTGIKDTPVSNTDTGINNDTGIELDTGEGQSLLQGSSKTYTRGVHLPATVGSYLTRKPLLENSLLENSLPERGMGETKDGNVKGNGKKNGRSAGDGNGSKETDYLGGRFKDVIKH